MNKITNNKKVYNTPSVTEIKIDHEISLALESEPAEPTDWPTSTSGLIQSPYKDNSQDLA